MDFYLYIGLFKWDGDVIMFPWKHIIGFILSLVLTFSALDIALYTHLSKAVILAVIITLAFIQALLQLLMFMHLTEGDSKKIQVINMIYSFYVGALVIAGGTVWVMMRMYM